MDCLELHTSLIAIVANFRERFPTLHEWNYTVVPSTDGTQHDAAHEAPIHLLRTSLDVGNEDDLYITLKDEPDGCVALARSEVCVVWRG